MARWRLTPAFGGQYKDLSPGAFIRYYDKFDDPNLPGEMEVSVSLKHVLCGTGITITQEGIPEAIPVESATAAGRSHSHSWPTLKSAKFRASKTWEPRPMQRHFCASDQLTVNLLTIRPVALSAAAAR